MGVVGPQEASSSTFRCSYHVFLSFRGKDTRKTFADHLCTALEHAGLRTFSDDDELQRGENIESELQKAIKESKISIVVFSTNYASSRWCLDELLKILECQKTSSHIILPIFYNVLPTEVRFQTGSFEEAFARHVDKLKLLKTDVQKREGMEKVERWKAALKEVADLSGMELKDGHEAKFIQSIIKDIGIILDRTVLSVALHPIGIYSHVSEINCWVRDGSNDVDIMTIYGMGGIGKTTIAKTVYNINFEMFDRSSFLANIRDVSKQPNGLVCLQRQLLSNILRGRKEKIYNIDEGAIKIREAVSCKKILLVLDDVDQVDGLNALLTRRDWFYGGTKIIITTRHKGLLESQEVCKTYKVKPFNNDESLELFRRHAFGRDFQSEKGYTELSQSVVKHCGGLPLALQVMGSSLYGKSPDEWKSALNKLETIPKGKIHEKLKISYDSLEDDHDKSLFLDIACFFVGMDKDYITTILDAYDVHTTIGIKNLIDRCLLIIDVKNKLTMHQLIRDMGREIVRQEYPKEPGKRSRLWNHEDVLNVLREKRGTKKIEGLIFNSHMSKEENLAKTSLHPKKGKRQNINESTDKYVSIHEANSLKRHCLGFFSWLPTKSTSTESFSIMDKMDVETEAFSAMQRLRLLQLNYARVCGGFGKFPRKLKWLCWRGFSLRFIPPDFHLENLVALDMRYSSMELVWKGTMCLRLLKILDLSYSHSLIRTPNFSEVPNLERLILKYCESLVQVHETIGCLERLVFWNLKGCKNLKKLPQSIGLLKSLKTLILVDCSKLDELPNELEKMQSLTVFHADGINQLPSREAKSRNSFLWSWLSKPKPLKFSLASLPRSLVDLSLVGCNLSDEAFKIDFGGMPLLQRLNLSKNSICSLPESIKGLNMLWQLELVSCNKLQSLPELPSSLSNLITNNCSSLQRISNMPSLLVSIGGEFYNCGKLVEIGRLFKLEPIGNFDINMVNNLGLDLELLQRVEIKLWNYMTWSSMKGPIQGLVEFGIFSTFIPGSDVPGCYSIKNSGNALSFTVTSLCDFEIRGLNIFVVYADIGVHPPPEFYIKIINKSKGMEWEYRPIFFGIPEANQDMIWLSHWEFGNQLEYGDEVDLSVEVDISTPATYIDVADKVKECGIQLVYRERVDKSCESPINSNLAQRNVIGGDLSAYETRTGSYFLSHLNYYWIQSDGIPDSPPSHNILIL